MQRRGSIRKCGFVRQTGFTFALLCSCATGVAVAAGEEEIQRCAEVERALSSPYAVSPDTELRSSVSRDAYEDMRARVLSQPDRRQREQLRRFYDRIECTRLTSDPDV